MDEPVIELDAEQAALRRRDADWVRQCLAGDQHAFGRLYDAWFDRVFDLVDRIVRNRDVAAEVAQEAFFAAWRNLSGLENPDAFGGWLLRIARNGALNRVQKEQRSYAVDDEGLAVIESGGGTGAGAPSGFGVEDRLGRSATPGAAVEDAEVAALVWQAAEALPERDVEVLDLQLRHGLSPAEIGEVMGMNRNAANQLVHRLKGRLETAVRARVLWRGGSPRCEVLAQRFADLGIVRFGPEAVRVTERHLPGCVECDERQRLNLEPAALFASLPMIAVPLVKHATATALAAGGVPMGGSAFLAAASVAGQAAGHAAGQAAGTLGGAVNPTIGSNVGHAVAGGGVDPAGFGSQVGNAISGQGSVGSNVGSAVSGPGTAPGGVGADLGGAVGGSPPVTPGATSAGPGSTGSGLGNAAGQELVAPTPIESAASYVGDVAAVDQAAKQIAGAGSPPAPIPPPPAPPSGGVPRVWLLSAAAGVALVLLFLGGLWWGGRGEDPELVAAGTPTAQGTRVPTTEAGTSTTGAGPTSTDTTVAGETTVPGETTTSASTPGPTNQGGTPTTRAGDPPTSPPTTRAGDPTTTPTTRATTTTQPTTTTTPPPKVSIAVTGDEPPKTTNGWAYSGPAQIMAQYPPPILTWSVDPSAGYTVQVTGPGQKATPDSQPGTFSSSMPAGSQVLCPGYLYAYNTGSEQVRLCTYVTAGDYTYTVTVKDSQGRVVATSSDVLRVAPAPIP